MQRRPTFSNGTKNTVRLSDLFSCKARHSAFDSLPFPKSHLHLNVRMIAQALDLLHQVAVVTGSQLRYHADHIDSNGKALQDLAPLGGCQFLIELRLG